MSLIVKDAARQIAWRLASAIWWFLVIKMITPYLGPLRFGDYSTILKYFAIWSAFADFGLYVIAMKQLGEIKSKIFGKDKSKQLPWKEKTELTLYYHKFVSSRLFMIVLVYTTALILAYLIPSYTSNPYLVRWLPLGMIFSASFMTAGILQIPLQLFWQMKHLSIGLILARIIQIAILWVSIYVLYPLIDFSSSSPAIRAFNAILISVIASGITQWIYVYFIGKKYLPLKRNWDRSFTKWLLSKNWKYGFAYYLSSFHTLIVLILLSIFYPTSEGFIFVGIYGLALSLIEILLIVPSALGNSLLHDIGNISDEMKRKRFGSLMNIVIIIWLIVVANFSIFAPHIINFLGWEKFLSTSTQIGSDWILPFLGIVITFSFIKQVFNYLFVSTELHNKLLGINLFGVVVGVGIWIPIILRYWLVGAVTTQILLEVLFVCWALFVAWRQNMLPNLKYSWSHGLFAALAWSFIVFLWSKFYFQALDIHSYRRVLAWAIINLFVVYILFPSYKKVLKKL